jgi:hypothetical protein
MQFKPVYLLYLLAGLVTLLCHARLYALPEESETPGKRNPSAFHRSRLGMPPKPVAHNDSGTTTEDTAISLNVLANDGRERGPDDEAIDPATVDLDPDTPQINQSFISSVGAYSVNDTGDLTFTPELNYTGMAVNRYTVRNLRGETSDPATVSIRVTSVNDPPTITGQNPNPIAATENQSFTVTLGQLIVNDPDNNYPDGFTLLVSAGPHYTVSGATVTPEQDYSGPLTVSVTVNDGENNSNAFDLQVTVSAVNDPPVITGQTENP